MWLSKMEPRNSYGDLERRWVTRTALGEKGAYYSLTPKLAEEWDVKATYAGPDSWSK